MACPAYVNSGAVGVVGSFLGGGFNPVVSSIHGLVMDQILSVEGITAAGETVKVGISSTGEDKALFNVLCGAGFGLLVITSVTMRIFKLLLLRLDDGDKFWTRKYTFAGNNIAQVLDFLQTLLPVQPGFVPTLLCVRAPPTAPKPGVPMLILNLTYYGPSHEAGAIVNALATLELNSIAMAPETVLAPFTSFFDATKMIDVHGDFKSLHSVRAQSISTGTFLSAFDRWKTLGEQVPDARATALMLSTYNPSATMEKGDTGNARPLRTDNKAKGLPGATQANNLRNGDVAMLDLVYTETMLQEIRRVHAKWNPDFVFYNFLNDVS